MRLAASGHEALTVYREYSATIDVALLDVNLPGMDGPETLAALRELNPAIRCCFMTGQTGRNALQTLRHSGAVAVFTKPFGLAEVAAVLRELARDRLSLATAEQRIAAEVADLRRSNLELNHFASTVAHDLRSPLMAVALCLAAIRPEQQDSERTELLSQARDSIVQMERLINALLSYARLGTGELAIQQCDCEAALTKALASVHALAKGIGAGNAWDELETVALALAGSPVLPLPRMVLPEMAPR